MNIFRTADHGRRFTQFLSESSRATGLEVHAYCLMPNHFHLLVHGSGAAITGTMKSLGSSYSRYFNDSVERDGPVFRSRFHCKTVDSAAYVVAVSRYIHRNPLERVGLAAIERYRWSSLRFYVGNAEPPGWLSIATILSEVGGPAAYRALVSSSNEDGTS